jgi:hypothetical protein
VCARMPRRLCGRSVKRRGPAVLIARPAAPGGRGGVVAVRHDRPGFCVLGAGVTFSNRTLAAEWAARREHASVVDAAGAIYVIGGAGRGVTNFFNDVWVSTDGGSRAGLGRGGGRGGYTNGYYGVTTRYYREY